jgi:beta-lactam-binding protein with PASTA domain
MQYVVINGSYYKDVFGGTIPAAIWRQAMSQALDGVPVQDLSTADSTVANGNRVPVPDVSGQPYDVAKQALADAGFGVRSGGFVSAAPVPFGVTPYTSPRAGRLVTVGTTITVYVSNGRERPPPPSPSPVLIAPQASESPQSQQPPPPPSQQPQQQQRRQPRPGKTKKR